MVKCFMYCKSNTVIVSHWVHSLLLNSSLLSRQSERTEMCSSDVESLLRSLLCLCLVYML